MKLRHLLALPALLVVITSNCFFAFPAYYDYEGNIDTGQFVQVDKSGNVFVCGTAGSDSNGLDIVVVKYNSSGTLQWSRAYNGSANGDDVPVGMVLDSTGNVYFAGTASVSSQGKNYVVQKIDTNNNIVWTDHYQSTGAYDDIAADMALVGNRLVVTGTSHGTSSSETDVVTILYDLSGSRQSGWSSGKIMGDDSDDNETAAAVTLTSAGVVVAGTFGPLPFGDSDWVLEAYENDGDLDWGPVTYDPANGTDVPRDMIALNNSDIFVCGYITDGGDQHFAVACFDDADGSLEWDYAFEGAMGGGEGEAVSIVYGSDSHVYATGWSLGSDGGTVVGDYDYVTSSSKRPMAIFRRPGTITRG